MANIAFIYVFILFSLSSIIATQPVNAHSLTADDKISSNIESNDHCIASPTRKDTQPCLSYIEATPNDRQSDTIDPTKSFEEIVLLPRGTTDANAGGNNGNGGNGGTGGGNGRNGGGNGGGNGKNGGTGTGTGTPKDSPSPGSSRGSLSTGAKAGIGAGVGVAVIAIAFGAGYFFLRRRKHAQDLQRKSNERQTQPQYMYASHENAAEMPDNSSTPLVEAPGSISLVKPNPDPGKTNQEPLELPA